MAAIILIGLPEFFRELEEYRMLAFGGAMVLIMLWKPRGLLAHREPTIRCCRQAAPPAKAGRRPDGAAGDGAVRRRPLLTVEHLTMRFGGLVAIDDVSFVAADGQITAIIGPNGAGKTTVFNCLTGFYKPTIGRLSLHGADQGDFLPGAHGGLPHRPGGAGMARTFQNIRLFPKMTVLENLIVAQHNKLMKASGWTVLGLLGLKRYRQRRGAAGRTGALLAGPGRPDRRWPTTMPATCPTATSAGWRSPAPCAPSRSCSAWTSRRPA